MTISAMGRLRELLSEVTDLRSAQALLGWDQEAYMPPAGVEARATQLATLGKLAHEKFTSQEVGSLLQELAAEVEELDAGSFEASLVRVSARDYEKATRIPARLIADLAQATALAQQAWRQAREEDEFGRFEPHLQRVLDLTREKAEALGYSERIYDALLDEHEPGMETDRVEELFAILRGDLVPLVAAIAEEPVPDDRCLRSGYEESAQWDFGLSVIRELGFDFDRGRQDLSAHPFSTSFSVDDVRITTRIQSDFLPTCLFGTLHEAGHAMYEQGVDSSLERSPLAGGTSLGIHESQSRLWENQVGRSRAFWSYYYPRLQLLFPRQLSGVSLDSFYRAINMVKPSAIRVEADEVTYNLHIMLRFELENALLEEQLRVIDLPEAWKTSMEETLGVEPVSDAEGVLQDIHWSLGAFGYFPTYSLGNLISAQLFERAEAELNDLQAQLSHGEFAPLLAWLQEKIHRHGRKYTAEELLHQVTGNGLRAEPWLDYVHGKFGALYPGAIHQSS